MSTNIIPYQKVYKHSLIFLQHDILRSKVFTHDVSQWNNEHVCEAPQKEVLRHKICKNIFILEKNIQKRRNLWNSKPVPSDFSCCAFKLCFNVLRDSTQHVATTSERRKDEFDELWRHLFRVEKDFVVKLIDVVARQRHLLATPHRRVRLRSTRWRHFRKLTL